METWLLLGVVAVVEAGLFLSYRHIKLRERLRRERALSAQIEAERAARDVVTAEHAAILEVHRELLENVPAGVLFLDPQGLVTYANPAMRRLAGTPEHGTRVFDLPWVRSQPTLVPKLQDVLHWERFRGLPVVHITPTGEERSLAITGVPVFRVPEEGDVLHLGAVLLVQDVTELVAKNRELEVARAAAEQAARAKADFLANMSHEIRTPMNAVIGMTGLLLETRLDAAQHEYASTIRASGEALLIVINDILDFSKIESGKLELERAPFGVRDCIESSMDIVAARPLPTDVDLCYRMDDAVPGVVVGDAGRLRQVLLNLLNNAVKFTHAGEVEVVASAEPVEGRVRLRFEVRDTGIGIAPDRLARLFRSFSQVDSSITRRYGGTGLGLAISKRLCEMMGGDIAVASVQGEGSTFTATVTVDRAADIAVPQHPFAGQRVVVVDDNAAARAATATLARRLGADALTAASVAEAERLIDASGGQILLVDATLPGIGPVLASPRAVALLPARHARAPPAARHAVAKPLRLDSLSDALGAAIGLRVAPAPDAEVGAAARRLDGLRVLVAEDNPVNQRLARLVLEREGCSIETASNGSEAVVAASSRAFDVVLMDLQMPEMDGIEATRRIRGLPPSNGRPRIVAMTANASSDDRAACLAAGMDDHVSKPIDFPRLVRMLETGADAPPEPEPPAAPSLVTLDVTVLDAMADGLAGDVDAVEEIVGSFIEDAEVVLARVQAALAAADAAALRAAAHTLKGNAATFGALALACTCREIEARATAGDLAGAGALAQAASDEWPHARAAIAAWRPPVR